MTPFYYEVKETKMGAGDFCIDFLFTFIHQYLAFKTRKADYLRPIGRKSFKQIIETTQKEGFLELTQLIEGGEDLYRHVSLALL